jgi:hypothetical protein
VDVKQAAEKLGISSEGVRQRIRRGSIESEKDKDGRVYVFVPDEGPEAGKSERASERGTDDVLTRLEGEVEFLRRELATRDAEIQRRDAILLSLSEGLKAINPPEPRESPQTFSEDSGSTQAPEDQERPQERRSWWRQFFGIE